MKNFLIAFGIFLAWAFFGLWLYFMLEPKENTMIAQESTQQNTATSAVEKQSTSGAESNESIRDTLTSSDNKIEETNANFGLTAVDSDGATLFQYKDGVAIQKNSSAISIPQTSLDIKYKLQTYLQEHPDMELHVISRYSPEENIENPNYGVQRGEEMEQILLGAGVPKEQIVIKPVIKDIRFDAEERYDRGISFAFRPLDEGRLELMRNRIPETMTVYPRFSDRGILINQELRDLLETVMNMMKDNPDATVDVVGHTDNVGNAIDNYHTGLTYARQARWFLVTKGPIDRTKIRALSKGETEPIDDNTSERGRIANRRLEIILYPNGAN
ncbi:OmpA family protein [Flavobacteriaceae bacterium TK19130]|nr:OmpA family protein [Thermobacterium salinum]